MASVKRPGIKATFLAVGDEDMIRIDFEGSAGDWHMYPVEPEHMTQFPKEWALYEKTRPDRAIDGTPISKLPGIAGDINVITMLTRKGVGTVEVMASLDDRSAFFLDDKRGIAWRDTAKLFTEKVKLEEAATAPRANTLRAPDVKKAA